MKPCAVDPNLLSPNESEPYTTLGIQSYTKIENVHVAQSYMLTRKVEEDYSRLFQNGSPETVFR